MIALNPMHVNLSHTFMTDVPFATITTWSLVFLCRGLLRRSLAWTVLGVLLAEGAVLSRQPGLAIPFALMIVLVAIGPLRPRNLVATAVIAAGSSDGANEDDPVEPYSDSTYTPVNEICRVDMPYATQPPAFGEPVPELADPNRWQAQVQLLLASHRAWRAPQLTPPRLPATTRTGRNPVEPARFPTCN